MGVARGREWRCKADSHAPRLRSLDAKFGLLKKHDKFLKTAAFRLDWRAMLL